jgi:porphobilinogen deaminase
LDGSKEILGSKEGVPEEAVDLAKALGEEMLSKGAKALMSG